MGSLGCKGFQEVRVVTTGYKWLHEETLDYKRLQWVTRGYRGYKELQKATRDYKRLQGVTRG